MFCVPDIRGARVLFAVNAPLSVLLADLALRLSDWPAGGVGLAVFLLTLRPLSVPERLFALGLLGITLGAFWLLPNGLSGWVLLLQPLLALLALAYLVVHRRAGRLDRHLARLGQVLGPGWRAYLPQDPAATHLARVLVSPGGQTFLVGMTEGRAVMKYGQPHVGWNDVYDTTVRALAARDWGVVSEGQQVLWVVRPRRAREAYPPRAEHGVSTVIATPQELAGQLQLWDEMRANLARAAESRDLPASSLPELSPTELGRAVEVQAAAELEAVLPLGWKVRRNLLLEVGGDADRVLTSPLGYCYAVDIRSRTDHMDLHAP